MKTFCSIVVLLAMMGPAAAATPAGGDARELFKAGNDLYAAGDYEGAGSSYRQLMNQGFRSASLHYNLGNALFKMGRLGPAILQYEKALALEPGDDDARANLRFLRSLTADKAAAAGGETTQLFMERLLRYTTLDQDAVILSIFYLAMGCLVAVGVVLEKKGLRRIIMWAVAGVSLPLVFSAVMFFAKLHITNSVVHAIILDERVDVRSGPGDDNTTLFTVHEGLRVRVRQQQGSWSKISTDNGLDGWVQSSSFGEI
ncbi:MAG: tetratricopeptide repeat protein [Acidobacteriota bacterium]